MQNMPVTRTADEIAAMAERGEDISPYFTNAGTMRSPIQPVQIDFPVDMLRELESLAGEMQVSLPA